MEYPIKNHSHINLQKSIQKLFAGTESTSKVLPAADQHFADQILVSGSA
jgi:hypothetical protein